MAKNKDNSNSRHDFAPFKVRNEMSEMTQKVMTMAEAAGAIIMEYYRQPAVQTDFKNNDAFDPVTTADRTADDFLRKKIQAEFPDDLILSEENEDIPTDFSKRIWMIDPLDGTKEFLKHTDGFSVHVGLLSEGKIIFGLVLAPAIRRLFCAERGQGAFERQENGNFKRLQVNNVTNLKDVRLLTRTPGKDKRPLDQMVDSLTVKERIADSRIKICRIACGEADAHVNTNFRASKWDTLGPQLILEEAGGVIVDTNGKPLDYSQLSLRWENSYIAANNQTILNQILATVKLSSK